MPEKHLFVNASHYQDKPDPNMRHKIASHAAKYGPNGSLAFKTSPEQLSASTAQAVSTNSSRHAVVRSRGGPVAPMQRSASISSATGDARLRQDYEAMLSKFDDFCACTDANTKGSKMKGTTKHSDDCSLLDDYLELCSKQELPFRVFPNAQRHSLWSIGAGNDNGLVLQCHLVATQAAIDGLDINFTGKPSKQTLMLQQKALSAMQKMISGRPNVIDDSLVLASAILMSVAAYFDDQDAYRTHKSSLQKMIDSQGGPNQTKIHRIIRSMSNAAEVNLTMHRYISIKPQASSSKKESSTSQLPQGPLKLKYPMPPFSTDLSKSISRLTPGFQVLANASKLSIQGLQLLSIACKWSTYIDQVTGSDTEQSQLMADTAGATARLLDLFTESVETRRLAAFVLLSLPNDAAHMRLERCLCLGLLQILHSLTIEQFTMKTRDRLATDFTETLMSITAKDKDEEACVIWLTIAVASEWRHCITKAAASSILDDHDQDIAAYCQPWLQKSKQIMDWIIVKYERARTWEDVAAVCARFLWIRRMSGEWKATWKDAMERRLRNMPRKKSRSSP